MRVTENIRQGLEAVKSNLLRTVITCLIITIGIAALVGILTSIDAMNSAIAKTFSRMGSQSFNIRNNQGLQRRGVPGSTISEPISWTQASGFKKSFDFPSEVSISRNAQMTAKVSYKNKETNPNVRVIGVDENYLKTASYELEQGRNFTSNDLDLALPVAIIGKEIANTLLGQSGLGEVVKVDGKSYRVAGILAEKGSSLGMSGGDRVVFIPVSLSRMDFNNGQENYFINVAINEINQLDPAMDEAYLLMRRKRGLGSSKPDDFTLTKSDALANDAIDNLKMVTMVGTIIAIITLIGAAVSLMNIMLVSVSERTREIGVRKALGASSNVIRNQFLTEAVVICQLGGLGGIMLGILLGNLVGFGLGTGFIIPWKWMLMSVMVCMVVGLVAGIYPATRAARLNPIDALRFE
ncbi:MAG: ABC transporter permease [Bacteroidetes bacterium]|nr:ABC transporter permease [Bacteroidota bacterium]